MAHEQWSHMPRARLEKGAETSFLASANSWARQRHIETQMMGRNRTRAWKRQRGTVEQEK